MPFLNICFRVHQPFQLKPYRSLDIDVLHVYEDEDADRTVIDRLADECYLPANRILLESIQKYGQRFRVSFSLSGVVLQLLQKHRPDVIGSFRALVQTGCVEILSETYYHSLSSVYSKNEFLRQIRKHQALINQLFGLQPTVFRNTELIHDNSIAACLTGAGITGIVCEASPSILNGRPADVVYCTPGGIPVLLRNTSLSDDIAFRFDDPDWTERPLTAEKFAGWIAAYSSPENVVTLFLDYETFGIHKPASSGIFSFLQHLPEAAGRYPSIRFANPGEIVQTLEPTGVYYVPHTISWENLSGKQNRWSANLMQHNALKKIYSLETMMLKSGTDPAIDIWGRLQAADYFHFMSDEKPAGDAYRYVRPFQSKAEVHRYYTNISFDLEIGVIRHSIATRENKSLYGVVGLY